MSKNYFYIRPTRHINKDYLENWIYEVIDTNDTRHGYFTTKEQANTYIDIIECSTAYNEQAIAALDLVKAIARLDHRIVWQNEAKQILKMTE